MQMRNSFQFPEEQLPVTSYQLPVKRDTSKLRLPLNWLLEGRTRPYWPLVTSSLVTGNFFKKFGILLAVLTLCGCSSAVTRVSIPVKVQSEIDISRYSNFAVLPFVAEKQTERNEKLPEDIGEEIAAILRRGLARQKHFDVVSSQETARLLTGETVGEDWLSDTEHLSQLGEYFEVKGIIIGSFRFYSDSRPRRYYGERYSVQRQRYVMDYQDYMQKTYLLSLRVIIIDVETEQIIWDEDYRRSTAEAHTIGSFIFSQAGPQANTVRELGKRAVSEFTRQISPHYEREDRYLVN